MDKNTLAGLRMSYLTYRQEQAKAAEVELLARKATQRAKGALQAALIEMGGWTAGQEIKLADGAPAWISSMWLNDDLKLTATCYRLLKSGQRSKNADMSVKLVDFSTKEGTD